MRGGYTAGVLDAFIEEGVAFDYCMGVSAGACNALSYIGRQKGRYIRAKYGLSPRSTVYGFSVYAENRLSETALF